MSAHSTLANPPDPPKNKSIDELSSEVSLLSAHIQAATCRLLLLIAEMDRREGYGDLGFVSCAQWLSWCTGERLSTAREKVRVARKLEDSPRIVEAFSRGQLSYSKVRAITRIVTPENETTLLEQALDATTSQLERVVRAHRKAIPAEQEQTARQYDTRFLSYHHDDDNMLVLRGRLPPEVGAVLIKALQVTGDGVQDDSAEPSQQLCDALGEVASAALDQGLAEREGKARPNTYQVLVHVDEAVLEDPHAQGICEVAGGVGVSAETSRRLSCDAPVLMVPGVKNHCCDGHAGKGCKLDLGQSRRRPGAALERAVQTRDEGVCQFPGCENRGHLQLHHVKHWAEGGATSLDNLTLLCSAHHRAVHEGGFTVDRVERGALRFRRPDGVFLLDTPRMVPLSDDPLEALVGQNEALELGIVEETGLQGWDGMLEVDYGGAVEGLMALRPRILATPATPAPAPRAARTPAPRAWAPRGGAA